MNWFAPLVYKKKKLAVGLVSGTSMDGIDAALCRISGSGTSTEIEVLDFMCRPYSPETKNVLFSAGSLDVAGISDLNFLLGGEFASAALELVEKRNSLPTVDIDFIGTHGQTVFHNPPSRGGGISSTLQLGEPDVICETTGITTVGDFRTRDVAAGGEGAPLVPYADFILFSGMGKNIITQNVGGISNCALVGDGVEKLIAFDTGPGNSLMDSVARLASGGKRDFDEDGELARKGSVREDLLARLMKNPYFDLEPPKSTGKELFGERQGTELFALVERGEIAVSDLMRTLVEFTSSSIVRAYEKFIFPNVDVREVVLSGGGARNPVLVSSLGEKLGPVRLSLSDEYGIPADAKEAVAFVILANETVRGGRGNVPEVTGARREVVLGKISIGENRS